jgi:hypothetical protein
MRVFAGGVSGAAGTRFVSQLTVHQHKVTGTCRSPGNAGPVRALGAGPIALGQPSARVCRRVAGCS